MYSRYAKWTFMNSVYVQQQQKTCQDKIYAAHLCCHANKDVYEKTRDLAHTAG